MTFFKRLKPFLAVSALVVAAGCVGDGDELLTGGFTPDAGQELFTRYVALGNSITAGFQSGGLVPATQNAAYPVLLAERAGVQNFGVPLVASAGCPPLFTAPLTPPSSSACAGRNPNFPVLVQNLAVPGARIRDLLSIPGGTTGQLNLVLVGPRSQARAMIEAQPTFVSVWIGNNDALNAALSGNLGPAAAGADSTLTTLTSFQTSLNALADSIRAAGPEGVMLVGVVNTTIAPLLQPGAYFFLARDPATGNFQGKPVNANCSPVTALGQPNPLAANLISFQIVSNASFLEINCDPAAYPVGDPRRGTFVLDAAEQAFIANRVANYNMLIANVAAANNWLYVNPNNILTPFLAETDANGRYQRIRKCQLLATATNAAQFQTAVLNSCPVTGPTAAPNFFGSLISFDGVHPSTEAHRILAGRFAAEINTKYGTTLSTATN